MDSSYQRYTNILSMAIKDGGENFVSLWALTVSNDYNIENVRDQNVFQLN